MPVLPQQEIVQGFGRPWSLRRPYLYRYLEKPYVDQFFKDGSIRLSSFNRFAGHADEHRADPEEGFCHVTHTNSEGTGQTIIAAMSFGRRAFVLCGSTHFDEGLKSTFECDSGFRINDTTKFAECVAFHIPGFSGGIEGPCHYLPVRSVTRDLGPQDLERFKSSTGGRPSPELLGFMNQVAGAESLFIKHKSYASQSEYRLLWLAREDTPEYIDIKCPEARAFCTRFEDLRDEVSKGSGRVATFYLNQHEKLMGRNQRNDAVEYDTLLARR